MTDLTKCTDSKCKVCNTCYRYTSPIGDRQSYFMKSPRTKKGCEYYLPLDNYKLIKFKKKETK